MIKKFSYIGVAFIVLLFGIYAIPKIVDRMSSGELNNGKQRLHSTTQKKTPSGLYTFDQVPSFEFINQHGDTITNATYANKVYVVEFFFTSCPTICPIMNTKMVDIQNTYAKAKDFGIASISITPEIDTPEVLKAYAERNQIRHPNWNLLTGQPEEIVYGLANSGFKLYAGKGEEEHGGFEHSGLFALIDKKGYIRSRKDEFGNPIMYYRAIEESGFGDQIKELKEDIKLLLDE